MQQPRAAAGGAPSHPTPLSRISSMPRPTVNTGMNSSEREYLESPPASTPDAFQFYGRRQPSPNQAALSNSTPTASRSFDPNTNRSVSGPALTSQKSSPVIAGDERMRKSSFKDLVARFNQAGDNDAPTPTTWRPSKPALPSASSVPVLSRSPNDMPRQQSIPAQRAYSSQRPTPGEASRAATYDNYPLYQSPTSTRPLTAENSTSATQDKQRPLFGELVPSGRQDREDTGFAIPRRRVRSGSEGSMHYPNAMFPQSRDSYIRESPIVNNTPNTAEVSSPVPTTPTHTRFHSDVTASHSPSFRTPAKDEDPGGDYQGDYKSYLIRDPPSSQPTPTSQMQSRAWPDNSAPAPSSSSHSNRQLNAIITAPAPKESPPLRSSRPRQDINAARGGSPSQRTAEPRSPEKPRAVTALNTMDIATRRESIRRALREKGWPTDQLAPQSPGTKNQPINRGQTAATDAASLPQLSSATYTRPAPQLKLDVPTNPPAASDEPASGTTHFEEDDSPLPDAQSGTDGRSGATTATKQSNFLNRSTDTDNSPSLSQSRTDPHHDSGSGRSDQQPSRTVWSQVLDIRRRDTTKSSQSTNYSSPGEQDEAGTIQIMLSDTPVFSSPGDGAWHSRAAPQASEPNHEAAANDVAVEQVTPDPSEGSSHFTATPGSNMNYETVNFRRNRDPYSWISRILDQYRESGVVSPEMVYDFQQHIVSTDPDISTQDDIDSMTLAKAALEDIIKDHANSLPSASRVAGATFIPSGSPSEDPFWQGLGSNVTVAAAIDPQHQTVPGAIESPLSPRQANVRNLTSDEPGPTPPPKDPDFNPYVVGPQTDTLPATAYNAPKSQAQPMLPHVPSTDGSLALSLPLNPHNDPASDNSGLATPSNASMHSQNPSTNGAQDGSITSTVESESSANLMKATLMPQAASGTNPRNSIATSSSMRSLDVQQDSSSQAASNEKDASGANSTTSQSPEQRRLNQRRHTLKELVDTEFSFNHDMKVIEDIYKGTATSVSALSPSDIRILFGNSAQIVEFSEAFLDGLKQAARSVYTMPRSSKWSTNRISASESTSEAQTEASSLAGIEQTDEERDRNTSVGEAFLAHMTRMEKVYGDYLKNHDLANQKLQKLQSVSEVRLWLNECHAYASDITSAWDLDSLLVKPVQRILKYPLLLRALLEQTPTEHPDHSCLELAAKQSEEISHRINESKKRAELLEQISNKNVTKRREFDPLKVFVRRTDKIAHRVGLSEAVEDAEYKRLAEKFGGRYFQLQIVMRDIEMYKKAAEEFMKQFNRYSEAIEELIDVGHSNSPEIESKWRKFAMTIREMTAIAYADHETAVKKHCVEPILALIKLHEGPQKLMQKRKKRIVEYAKYLTLKNRGDRIDKKTQEQGDQFIALNDTLKDELPKLFNLTARLVEACLKNFIDIQAQWHTTWQRKIRYVLEEQNIANTWDEIVEVFNSDFSYTEAHVLSLGICNGSLLAETSNFLSSASSFVADDTSSTKRPSLALQKTSPSIAQNEFERRSGGSYGLPSLTPPRSSSDSYMQTSQASTGQTQYNPRYRADSNLSVNSSKARNNQTPLEQRGPTYNPASYWSYQSSRQPQRSEDTTLYNPSIATPNTSQPSYLGAYNTPQTQSSSTNRPMSSSTFYSATSGFPNQHADLSNPQTSPEPSSGVFSSAMPLSDSLENTRPTSPYASTGQREYKVLFLAASLFEFTIDVMRKEAGYPFLTYEAGEIFDVIAEKGELWLAKNQDDPQGTIGWIWEKHFGRLMPD